MLYAMSRNWWALALRGLAAVLFGVATFIWPNVSLAVLVAVFGAYALVDGIFATFTAVSHTKAPYWWVLLLEGLVSIGAGVFTFVRPDITTVALLWVIATWAIGTGIFEVIGAIQLRKEIEGEWMLGLSGVLSVVCGVLLIMQPQAGALAVLWIIGSYAVIFGGLELALAFRMRGFKNTVERQLSTAM
ncbi:MAG: HdeD family acid-resistance protein [Anaerolineae bacterium]|nr:HdeD family acid-resistance protein [Anaerolineae bacterium]